MNPPGRRPRTAPEADASTWADAWWTRSFAAWLTVLGAASYAVLRLASDLFYAPLGLSPEEVGLDQVRMLVTATGLLIYTLLLLALLLAACELSGVKVRWRHRWWVAVAAIALYVVLLVSFALAGKNSVLDGKPFSALGRFILPWDAAVVEVRWIGAQDPPSDLVGLPCAVFVGSSQGVTFLVDPNNDRTLRVPTSDVVASAPRSSNVAGCGPEGLENP